MLLLLSVVLSSVVFIRAQPLDCGAVQCPRPLCANPVTPDGECCPSCENSNCKFQGCVNIINGEASWKPDPCSTCFCRDNEMLCGIKGCRPLTQEACLGFPVIQRPDRCCQSCDFGKPDLGCFAIAGLTASSNITVSETDKLGSVREPCSAEVPRYMCDKIGFRYRGRNFRCEPVMRFSYVRFEDGCPLEWGLRRATTVCKPVQDDNIGPHVGCDFIVD